MKPLVMLSALVSIAIAAPALPETHFYGTQPLQNTFMDLITREKKSPLEESDPNFNTETTNNFESETAAAARSIALKKPLLVKNKHGYRLYRDSDEEKALSDQACGRLIRFKLCDEDPKFIDTMRSSTHENTQTSDDDMKHSIEMAKEAVETLQRDLNKMERNDPTKMAPTNSESEELHEEIEEARQALNHIQKNFGNMESMSLHATATRDLDAVHDVHLTIAKTEEERMAQWKQAVENINKNFEIARNIEDSFKPVQENSLPLVDSTKVKAEQTFEENIGTHTLLVGGQQMRSMENLDHHVEDGDEKEDSCKATNEQFTGQHARQENPVEEDMNSSASTITKIQIANLNKEEGLRSENHINQEPIKIKSDEIMTDTTLETIDEPNHKDCSHLILKTVEQAQIKLDTDTQKVPKSSENILDSVIAPSMITNKDVLSGNEKNGEGNMDHDLNIELTKSVGDANPQEKHLEAKSNPKFTDPTMRMEQTDAIPNFQIQELVSNRQDTKSTEQLEGTNPHLDAEQDENFMFVKSAEHPLHNHEQNIEKLDHNKLVHVETLAQTKSAESSNNLRHETNDPTAPWAHDNRHNNNIDQVSSMKGAEELFNEFHDRDHLKHMNFNEHHHMQGEMDSASEFGLSDQTQLQSGKFHHNRNLMTHGKMADMRGVMHPNFHTSMRDVIEGFGSENMLRWQPTHESSRSAYGIAGVAAPGAVGVFPNANAGSCGIPLLLSCSPSVVSGSLAKAHPAASGSYAAPSYRTEDEFNFPKKRDTKKANDMLTPNVLRSPAILKQKSETILENKL